MCLSQHAHWMRTHERYGVLDPKSDSPGYGQCLWNVEAMEAGKKFKALPASGARTMPEVLAAAIEKNAARQAVGWRELVHVHQVEDGGAKREKIELANEYRWLSYGEYGDRIRHLASGLAEAGLQPKQKVVIYAETQLDWMTSAFAAWSNGAQIVTIYATLGEEGAAHGINQTKATTVVVDAKLLKSFAKILPKCQSVCTVVTMTSCAPDIAEGIKSRRVELVSVDELVQRGKDRLRPSGEADVRPAPDDVALIMYTSGTTAAPKGVMITHANIVAAMVGVEHDLEGLVDAGDKYLCYLPLAHIMEMVAEICFLSRGAALGYGSPHTLTDSSVKLKRPESIGDAPLLGPSFMVFAPAVLDKIYQVVQGKKAALTGLKRTIFEKGIESGIRRFNRGQMGANAFYNSLVFKKIQALVGGNLKAMITGSAPLSPDIQKFVQTVFNAPVRQGYGLTETCAGSCVAFWGDQSVKSVGPPTVCTVIRLADWPEGNYMNSDVLDPTIGMRRGEVLIGGPTVSLGYYVDPQQPDKELQQKNKEDWVVLEGIRFFRTGDIGQIRKNGTLEIIDRKKDLWKGPNGEYVALTKVEAALKLCEFVEMPMAYGKTGGEHPVALICPMQAKVLALGAAAREGAGSNAPLDFESLCKDSEILQRITKACQDQCRQQKLLEFEIPKKIALISELWTPENDMLTAAMKLKRPTISAKHKADIDALY